MEGYLALQFGVWVIVPGPDILRAENDFELPLFYCTDMLQVEQEMCRPSNSLSTDVFQCPAGPCYTCHTSYALIISYCRLLSVHLFSLGHEPVG